MLLVKLKGLVNLLSAAGIRLLVATSALMGTTMVAYSGYSLYEQVYTQNRAFESGIQSFESDSQIRENQDSLAESREDYRAWLRVRDTHIDYPVMQGRDDLYYANHDVDGKSSLTGAIYLSAGNVADLSDNYLVIFGHHMDNGAMFGDLDRFLNPDFFEEHQEGLFVYPGVSYDIHFFAAMETDAYDDNVYLAGNRDLKQLISYISEHASVQKPLVAKDAEKIIALSTCADAKTNGRLLVFGVLTPTEDEPEPSTTVVPTVTGEPTPSEEPTITDEPTPSVEPTITDEPTPSVEPTITDEPVPTVTPTVTGAPSDVTPVPTITKKPGGPDAPKTGEHVSGLNRFFDRFMPGGSSYGFNAWALVNLVCLLVTMYILLPFNRLREKFGRIDKMRKVNRVKVALWYGEGLNTTQLAEREEIMRLACAATGKEADEVSKRESEEAVEKRYYHVGSFARRFTLGIVVEAAVTAAAFIAFINTENMRLPMILIDKWTPMMLLLMVTCWVADIVLTRYRDKEAEKAEKNTAR
ncbi:MAG: sortase [Lachnospiraceae bacterium]|nr:sortase [Lachnospiraceae bacterium]